MMGGRQKPGHRLARPNQVYIDNKDPIKSVTGRVLFNSFLVLYSQIK